MIKSPNYRGNCDHLQRSYLVQHDFAQFLILPFINIDKPPIQSILLAASFCTFLLGFPRRSWCTIIAAGGAHCFELR